MTLRAVVQDGLIVVNTHGAIADGTTVEISVPEQSPEKKAKKSSRRKAKTSRSSKQMRVPGYGMWADWKELGSGSDSVARFRALTRRKRVG